MKFVKWNSFVALPSFSNDYNLRFFVAVVFEVLRWSFHRLRIEETVSEQAVLGSL